MNGEIKIGKKQKISEMIVEELIRKIQSGELKVGEKLPNERALSETLGVSRMPIREAIHALAEAGILETKHGEGTYVSSYDSEKLGRTIYWFSLLDKSSLNELIETRRVLEAEAARLACRNGTDEEIEAIKTTMLEREALSDIDADDREALEKRFDAGNSFHEAIIKASHNSIFLNFTRALRSSIKLQQKAAFNMMHTTSNTTDIHREIYEAILAGDGEKAERKMKEHLGKIEEAVRKDD